MLDITELLRGDIVCHRFTKRRYRVVSIDRFSVLVVPAECPLLFNPAWSLHSLWFDFRLLELV